MKTREKRERLLVGLYQHAKSKGFDRYLTVRTVADGLGVQREPGELRLWVKELEQLGMLEVSYTLGVGADGGMDATLTSHGVEEAEELLEQNPSLGAPPEPEKSSYISAELIAAAASSETADLRAAVQSSNAIDDLDRQIALSEIAVFEAALSQPIISADLVDRFINRVLRWLTSKFVEGLVATIAAALIIKLLPFLAT